MRDSKATEGVPSDCPSEAELDAYQLDELDGPGRARIESCPRCQTRLQERRAMFEAIPDKARLIEAIHVGVVAATNTPARPQPGPRFWVPTLAGLGALAAALVVLVPPSAPTVRSKGGVGLTVFVERHGQVVQGRSGDIFHPGDRLRFEVDSSRPLEIMILGREASGRVFPAFPLGAERGRSQPLASGTNQVLPGAVALDESSGRETLYLVGCPRPFGKADLRMGQDGLDLPDGCSTDRFVLEKVRP